LKIGYLTVQLLQLILQQGDLGLHLTTTKDQAASVKWRSRRGGRKVHICKSLAYGEEEEEVEVKRGDDKTGVGR